MHAHRHVLVVTREVAQPRLAPRAQSLDGSESFLELVEVGTNLDEALVGLLDFGEGVEERVGEVVEEARGGFWVGRVGELLVLVDVLRKPSGSA